MNPVEASKVGAKIHGISLLEANALGVDAFYGATRLPRGPGRIIVAASDFGDADASPWVEASGGALRLEDSLTPTSSAAVTHLLAHGTDTLHPMFFRGIRLDKAIESTTLDFHKALRIAIPGLVVLSSCAAADAPRRSGDGAVHGTIGGALLMGEAHTIVHSFAQIRFLPHQELMTEFYRGLGAGRSTRAALRDARAHWARAHSSEWLFRFEHAQLHAVGAAHLAPLGPK
ncbi:MAG: CHAT domain-containing protein [Myxococcota bacterium]